MELNDKIIVITGAASGIGRAMALRFAAEKPQKIICTDIDFIGAQATASDVGGWRFGLMLRLRMRLSV